MTDSVFITAKIELGEKNLALSIETEDLQKKKEELEGKLQSMMKEGKTLKDIKILEVSVAIQKLEEKIKTKREVVEKLEIKKSDLEKELNEPETPKNNWGTKT
jgi:chromosome segregation ATPase